MQRHSKPAIDPQVMSGFGQLSDGQPTSYNRAPSPDLSPWIGRVYASKVILPPDYVMSCGLFGDTAFIRVQLQGDWAAITADGLKTSGPAALFFGPNTKRMPISVTGSFVSIGVSLRPGTCAALKGPVLSENLDKTKPLEEVTALTCDFRLDSLDPDGDPEDWILAMESLVRGRVEAMGSPKPDPVATQFECIAYRDPSITVGDAAQECGVDRRKLERIVSRDFGMSPKQVLRRARALDMASHLRGVADKDETNELALRYYDESHLIHEFAELFGMSPRQFVTTPQPLLTLSLESRQARRLEMLDRIKPGAKRPWEGLQQERNGAGE